MKFSEAFATESKYVKSDDLKGRRVPVVIESYQHEVVGQGDDARRKVILYFQGKTKGMVCNPTNGARIADMYGEDMDDWIGREIVLVVERVPFAGKMVPGIRVHRPEKRAPQQQNGPQREHTVTDRGGYKLHETRQRDPIEEATDAQTRDPMDEPIPF